MSERCASFYGYGMANLLTSVAENVPGEFFVDATCIDCDTCRQLAPRVFGETGEHAYVWRQPANDDDRRTALQALVCCPTGSIGRVGTADPKLVMGDFPQLIDDGVHYCGFNSHKSYGGNSYFIRRAAGNWLVDSPKFLPRLGRRFEELGGLDRVFLTHRDDIADAEQYAQRFGAKRIIHRAELAYQPGAEIVLDGQEPVSLGDGFVAIPTPGHTAGHCVLLLDDSFLFTGDHLAFDRGERRMTAFRDYCWDSWQAQIESTRRLASHRFEWVLPGHGQRVNLPADEMRRQLLELVERMRG